MVRTIGIAALLALTVAPGGTAAAAPATKAVTVRISDYAFQPAALTVPVGTEVMWTDQDNDAHNVTSSEGAGRFTSPTLTKGMSYSHTFRTLGTYQYVCTFHATMRATVTVIAHH
jgi:plastocyanin